MGKVLRILVILILLLSIGSLILANMLFQKRDLLVERNKRFESTVIKLAKTIENEDAEEAAPPTVEKDISEVTDRELVNPDKQSMLEGYPVSLEQQNLPFIDLDNDKMKRQLRSLYLMGPDGKPILDSLTQKPSMKEPGAMQDLLNSVVDRAKVQQEKLNKTRSELSKMREKLTTTVEEVNSLKIAGRADKKEITEKTQQIATLEDEKSQLETRVTKLTAEKKELNAELADANSTIETINNEKLTLEEDLTTLREAYEDLKVRYAGLKNRPNTGSGGFVMDAAPSAGDKGKIIEANDELKFAILELSSAAIEELMGPERQNQMPPIEMNVRRPGRQSAAGEFVTRIRLRQVVQGKNYVVADILTNWQQTAVEKGDVVFF